MTDKCQVPLTISRMKSGWWAPVAFMGGSLTIGTGASNTAATSWRRLFIRWLHERFEKEYHCRIGEVMCAIGAMGTIDMAYIMPRFLPRKKPALVFIEHCINDGPRSEEHVFPGIEGIMRQLAALDPRPDIVVLRAPTAPGSPAEANAERAFAVHRKVAGHYGASVIDVNRYLQAQLAARRMNWNDIGIDNFHMGDAGNRICFDCLREWFEKQTAAFEEGPACRTVSLPEPLYSSELQHTRLIEPARARRHIELAGNWERGDHLSLPWWMYSILVGKPGAELRCTFTGTAVCVVTMNHPDGVKVKARIDGETVCGPYTVWQADFGRITHCRTGMARGTHVLELTVGNPQKGKNLGDPAARIAWIGVAGDGPDRKS